MLFFIEIREPISRFNTGSIMVTRTPRSSSARVSCGNCGFNCGRLVKEDNIRITVDAPVDIVKLCDRKKNYKRSHRHHYIIRTVCDVLGSADQARIYEPKYEPREHSRQFDGPMHQTPFRVLSPCLMQKVEPDLKLNLIKRCCESCVCTMEKEENSNPSSAKKLRFSPGTFVIKDNNEISVYPPALTGGSDTTNLKSAPINMSFGLDKVMNKPTTSNVPNEKHDVYEFVDEDEKPKDACTEASVSDHDLSDDESDPDYVPYQGVLKEIAQQKVEVKNDPKVNKTIPS